MKAIYVIFFFYLSSAAAQPTSCLLSIKGKVVDERGTPLPGASIRILELERGTSTNQLGDFVLDALCENTYTLTASFLGYASFTQKVKLKKSETVFFQLSTDETVLNEVVVQDHYDHISASQTTTALSGSGLDATRGKTLGAALRSITGVNTIQSGPAIFKPVIHGVHSQRILILNNGVRHEGQQWGAEHAPEIDPFLASNIVVVKDASAIKYGTDALGGVVIVNPAPLPTGSGIGGSMNMVVQSNGRSGVVSGILEGASKKWNGLSWRTQGTLKKSGDFHTPNYSLTNTGVQESNYSMALGYHKNEASGLEIFYSHFATGLGILKGSSVSSEEDLQNAYESTVPQYTRDFSYTIESPKQEAKHDLLKATAHFHRGVDTYSLQYAFQHNQRKEFDLRRGALSETPSIDLTMMTHTLDAEWEHEPNESTIRCIGINSMVQSNDNNPGTQRLPFIPNYSNYSGGVYLIQKLNWKKWKAEAGARFDYRYYTVAGRDYSNQVYKDQFHFANVSATFGATRNVARSGLFTTGLSTAWRPPHVAELYSLGTHQSAAAIEYGLLLDETTNEVRTFSSVDFRNEKALKWVNTYVLSKKSTQLELSAYANYIFNYIHLRPEGITKDVRGTYPYFRYRQTDASFIGVDLLLNQTIYNGLSVRTKVSLLAATDESNDYYFIYIPSNRVDLALRYDHPLRGKVTNGFIEAGINYVAEQHRAPRVVTVAEIEEAKEQGIDLFETDNRMFDFVEAPNAYLLTYVSLGSTIQLGTQKLDVRISCDNLLDESYREYTNRLRYFSDEVGRNVSFSLKYSF